MGNAVQSNSIAAAFNTAFGLPQWIMGAVLAVLALFVFLGGTGRIPGGLPLQPRVREA